MGLVYRQLGRPEEALSFYERARDAEWLLGNTQGWASVLVNIGVCYDSMKKYNKALIEYQRGRCLSCTRSAMKKESV